MTAEQISALAGGALSLLLAYLPFVSAWYDKITPQQKVTVMGLLITLSAVAIWAFNCRADAEFVACLQRSAPEFVSVLWAALTANVGVYVIAVRQFKR